jgi:glutathione S-transferase
VLTLYHREQAGRPPRVRWALEEAGAPYRMVVMTREESRTEPHTHRHPLGRVPVLETEAGYLWESAAVCLQVADAFPAAGLNYEPGSYERGLVYQWTVFAMSEVEPALVELYLGHREEDSTRMAAADARVRPLFEALERVVASSDYLTGSRFTVADVVVGGVVEIANRIDGIPAGPLADYIARLAARPAFRCAYAGDGR